MSECLVTKLRGKVNDNSLLPLGGMLIHVTKQETEDPNLQQLSLITTENQTISVVGGMANLTLDATMASGWTSSIEVKANSANNPVQYRTVYCKNGDYDVLLSNKYAIVGIGMYDTNIKSDAIGFSLDDIKYSKDFHFFFGNNLRGDISNLKGKVISNIYLNDGLIDPQALTGDINVLNDITFEKFINDISPNFNVKGSSVYGNLKLTKDIPNLTALMLADCFGISVNINDMLQHLPDLTFLSVSNSGTVNTKITGTIDEISLPLTSLAVHNTNVTGTLEGYVRKQREAGRETGSTNSGGWWGAYITFDGEVPSASERGPVSWTANTITLGEKTINA